MDVHSQWTQAVNENVYTQVVLQIIYQMRLVKVLLHDVAAVVRALLDDPFTVPREVNALALGEAIRLHDVGLLLFQRLPVLIVKLFSKVTRLVRQHPCLGKEIVFLWKRALHLHQIPRQIVLPRDNVYTWVLVHFLIGSHLR